MKRLLFIIINICFFISVSAQEEREIKLCSQAEEAYKIGQFDEVENILSGNFNSFSSRPKVTALRLLALSCLERDQVKMAEQYVSQLLKEDPYYNIAMTDPVRFADLVERLKRGEEATIVTASQQAESLSEAPVPVTLITEEMIKQSGARNLADLLLLYVPGMSSISGAEMNLAMHGVYSSTQEKILIMLDGHRLNSRATNAESPDYRTSLNKIKQIEVLRGPASSLYGNVALTAVVNIITKKGREVDGVEVSAGVGNNHTYRADFLMGKRGLGIEFLGWASFFASEGEKRYVGINDDEFYGKILQPGMMYIGGFNHRPSFDIGFTAQWKGLKLLFSMQDSKQVTPYNMVFFPGLYSYDKYRKFNGVKPGHSRKTTRADLSHEKQWNEKWYSKINTFIDFENCINYDIAGDSLLEEDRRSPIPPGEIVPGDLVPPPGPMPPLIPGRNEYGSYQIQTWQDYTYGLTAQTNYVHQKENWYTSLLVGLQMENYVMQDNSFCAGDHFDRIVVVFSEKNRSIQLGNELNVSPFIQTKLRWKNKVIFNGGLRFDYKNRFNGKKLSVLSPRMSVIYKLNQTSNLKLSYSHSFVDAPFFYRASTIATYQGGRDLDPEQMDAIQLSFDGKGFNGKLKYESILYYNSVKDLVFTDGITFDNAGSLNLFGIENVLSFTANRFSSNLNFSYQRLLDFNKYRVVDKNIYDVPNFMLNFMLGYNVFKDKRYGSSTVRMNGSFYSKQSSPIKDFYVFRGENVVSKPDNELPARMILNLGVDYSLKNISFAADIYNLLNTNYYQGGRRGIPFPQQRISVMFKGIYKF